MNSQCIYICLISFDRSHISISLSCLIYFWNYDRQKYACVPNDPPTPLVYPFKVGVTPSDLADVNIQKSVMKSVAKLIILLLHVKLEIFDKWVIVGNH